MSFPLSPCEADILELLLNTPFCNQRRLAKRSGHSLGAVNRALKELVARDFLDSAYALRPAANAYIDEHAPKNAIILAAGGGMRMAPINTVSSKALLEIHGETLIERLIRQLREAGIREISVVVGFMKEQLEFLIDEYDVKLVVNEEYAAKENLHSLSLVASQLGNTYIVPCDIWSRENPFRRREYFSWYMVSDRASSKSHLRLNRKSELVRASAGNTEIGIAYLTKEDGEALAERVRTLDRDGMHGHCFWEEALYDAQHHKLCIPGRIVSDESTVEINTYEQLRELDSRSRNLDSDAIDYLAKLFGVTVTDIKEISVLKKGMTNRSFLFSCLGTKYIMRIPGEGTDQLIDREQEAAVYRAIEGKGLCDDLICLDPSTGYKVTKFIEGVRACDPESRDDVIACMKKLRAFHELDLKVPKAFDLYEKLAFYESLWGGLPSSYRDYETTKLKVLSLRPFIERQEKRCCLTHIDAVPDNFLFCPSENGGETVQLIDWEYAGMQDPHLDIAMFSVYSAYDKPVIDRLIDLYFDGEVRRETRAKIYCYIATCGLLWSGWCEYKRTFGVEFGEYSLTQYRYAKEFYQHAITLIQEEETLR